MNAVGGIGIDYSTTQWNESQSKALMQIQEWAASGRRTLTIGGLAGTGKSHLSGYIPQLLGKDVTYCAPTGRAASILTKKSGIPARTIHSLLRYGPSGQDHEDECAGGTACVCASSGDFVKLIDTDMSMWDSQIIIADEASMINSRMWNELLGLGARVVAVGDYGQLPPVGDSGFCVVSENRLDIKLDQIVRQSADSPIIQAAWEVRQGAPWPVGATGAVEVQERPMRAIKVGYKPGRAVLCATNRQRVKRNKEIRMRRGLPAEVVVGDEVINLRNDPMRGVMNGEVGTVVKVGPGSDGNMMFMIAEMENGTTYVGDVARAQFNSEKNLANDAGGIFDFSYCRSVHKMQGSEADEVLLIAENIGWMSVEDRKRWRYTAVTRAREKLTVIVPKSEGY